MAIRRGWRPGRRGFTLLELMVVIGMIFLLLAILLPSINYARARMHRLICANNLRQWAMAASYYREDWGNYLPGEGTLGKWTEADAEDATEIDDKGPVGNPHAWFNSLPPYLGSPSYAEVERRGDQIKEYPGLHVWVCPAKDRSKVFKSKSGKNQFHYGMNMVLDGMNSDLTPDFPDRGSEYPIWAPMYAKEPNTVFMFDIYQNMPRGKQENVAASPHGDFANVLFLDSGVVGLRGSDFVKDGDFKNPKPIWDHPKLYWGYRPKSSVAN